MVLRRCACPPPSCGRRRSTGAVAESYLVCGSSRLVERQTTHAGVLPWIRGRPDLQLGGGVRQRLCHVMYLSSEGTSLSVFHNWVVVGGRFSLACLSVQQRRLGACQRPKSLTTKRPGWPAGPILLSSKTADWSWLSSTSLLIRLRPSLVPPVNTTCTNLPSRLP